MPPTSSTSSVLPLALPRWPDMAAALLALAALIAWDASPLDLLLIRHWGTAEGFPWRDQWLTARVLHEGGRALALGGAALLLINIKWPLWPKQSLRERIWWLAATVACALLIPLFKRASTTSCPWDLAEFSGTARYVSHWSLGMLDGGPGHCFPSGHASAAFAFVSGYFALRRAYPRAAQAWLLVSMLAGCVFGWVQMARGAHYASHTLWTAWICWVTCTLGARWLLPPNSAARGTLAS